MSATLFRTGNALRAAASIKPAAASLAGASFVRTKATLPDLPYDYGALEPYISGKIMELHHKKHHNTYVQGLNSAVEQVAEAQAKGNTIAATSFSRAINFHGGGHINHSLFWENLAPCSAGGKGGVEPAAGTPLRTAIDSKFGGIPQLTKSVNAALAGIQGSGWAWLVQDGPGGPLGIVTRPNQDPVDGSLIPLLGIDAWEHAYYLQYENRKVEYFDAIWNVVNWETVANRMK